MPSFLRPAALLVAAGLVVVHGSARADPTGPATPERRRGFDVEAHLGIVGSLCRDCDLNLGRTAGGAILYRAFPHFAVGVAGDALVFPYPGYSSFSPGGTLYTGLIGLTMRGYLLGHGPVDGFVGLTVGGVPIKVSDPSIPAASGQAGIEGIVGAEIHLRRWLRVSTSVAFTSLLFTGPDLLIPGYMPGDELPPRAACVRDEYIPNRDRQGAGARGRLRATPLPASRCL